MSGKVSPCLLYLTDIELSGSNINISGPPSLQLWTLVLDLCEPGCSDQLGWFAAFHLIGQFANPEARLAGPSYCRSSQHPL
jgi:hypothetical protein